MGRRENLGKSRDLRCDGWVPHKLAYCNNGQVIELTGYPYPSEDGNSVLISGRAIPGHSLFNTTWMLIGEKLRPSDDQKTGLRDLRLLTVVCPKCRKNWQPRVAGKFLQTHITCNNCLRDYAIVYDAGQFVGFAWHHEWLILQNTGWKINSTD